MGIRYSLFRSSLFSLSVSVSTLSFLMLIWHLEKAVKLFPTKGVDQIMLIIDVKSKTSTGGPSLDLIKQFLALGDHYPERIRTIFVLNPSWLIWTLSALVKPFLSSDILRKVHFMNIKPDYADEQNQDQVISGSKGTGGFAHILEWVDPEQLLKEYGGLFDFEFQLECYETAMEIV